MSAVDVKVIAMGLSIARAKGEYKKVNLTPQSLSEFKPKSFKPFYADEGEDDTTSSDEDDKGKKTATAGDDWTVSTSSKKAKGKKGVAEIGEFIETEKVENSRRKDIKEHVMTKMEKKIYEAKKAMAELNGDEIDFEEPVSKPKEDLAVKLEDSEDENKYDDEEEGGQWVTAENLYSHIGGADGQNLMENNDNLLFTQGAVAAAPKTEDEKTDADQTDPATKVTNMEENKALSPFNPKPAAPEQTEAEKQAQAEKMAKQINYVKFITSDFAMQNVIIQMGFQLLNLDGMRLTRVKRFKLLCKGCHWLNMQTERLFCEKCGGATLAKVSVYLNDNGEVTYFKNPKRKINLKGTIYSIPKPKGGRGCQDLVLREDDLMKGEYK